MASNNFFSSFSLVFFLLDLAYLITILKQINYTWQSNSTYHLAQTRYPLNSHLTFSHHYHLTVNKSTDLNRSTKETIKPVNLDAIFWWYFWYFYFLMPASTLMYLAFPALDAYPFHLNLSSLVKIRTVISKRNSISS